MGKPADLVGQQFNRLTVKQKAGSKGGKVFWECECSCGGTKTVHTSNLRSGKTQSCGCLQEETKHTRNFIHGGAKRINGSVSVEYASWEKNKKEFPEEWKEFKNFFKDIGWKPSAEHVLARHDIRLPHGPGNTYWRHEQNEKQERLDSEVGPEFRLNLRGIFADTSAGATASVGTPAERQGVRDTPAQRDRATATRTRFTVLAC
jgi:hypothetical protein